MSFYNTESLLLLASPLPSSVEDNQETSISKTAANVPLQKLLLLTSFSTRAQSSENQQTFACGSIRSVNAGQESDSRPPLDLSFW